MAKLSEKCVINNEGIMKSIAVFFVTIVMLSSCTKNSNFFIIENAPIIISNDIDQENELPVTLIPVKYEIYDKYNNIKEISYIKDDIKIGYIKDGKLNMSFQNRLDDNLLFNPEELEYKNKKGVKITSFKVNLYILLINDNLPEVFEMEFIIYSNKKGKITRNDEEIVFKKGWNIYIWNNEKLVLFNPFDLLKKGYKWYVWDMNGEYIKMKNRN